MTKPKAPDQRLSSSQRSEINRRNGAGPNLDPLRLSEIRAQASRVRWDRPGEGQRQAANLQARWTPEMRTEASAYAKTPEVAARLAAGAARASQKRWANDNGRMSETMRAHWSDPANKQKLLEAARTPEKREASRQGALNKWNSMTPEQQRAEMRRLHGTVKGGQKVSALEAKVVMVLNQLSRWYRFHEPVGDYVADILVQGSPMIDIECDGIYWHGPEQSDHDTARDQWFAANGYNVIRVRDDDVDQLKGLLEG